jgi:hypothetical protein
MTFDKEFKEAISRLPSSEKDKLIFRLLKKDLNLTNQLFFELVSADSKEDKRKQAKEDIRRVVNMSKQHCKYLTLGILMMDMRDAAGIVNEHVNITKDKYGEVYLHLFILKEYLKIYNTHFKDYQAGKSYTMNIYITAKIFKVMVLLKKMHEDLLIDFADDFKETGRLFGDNPNLMKVATQNGLNINWLTIGKIPDNITEIEKDLRRNGYLK